MPRGLVVFLVATHIFLQVITAKIIAVEKQLNEVFANSSVSRNDSNTTDIDETGTKKPKYGHPSNERLFCKNLIVLFDGQKPREEEFMGQLLTQIWTLFNYTNSDEDGS